MTYLLLVPNKLCILVGSGMSLLKRSRQKAQSHVSWLLMLTACVQGKTERGDVAGRSRGSPKEQKEVLEPSSPCSAEGHNHNGQQTANMSDGSRYAHWQSGVARPVFEQFIC